MLGSKRDFVIPVILLLGSPVLGAPGQRRPAPAPARLYFDLQWHEGPITYSRVFAMDPDGSRQICLTPNSQTDYHPALSPDCRTIAFTTHRDGIRAIYLMDSNGTNQRRLTYDGDAGLCAWSPDGKRLTFSSNRNGRYCIYVMNADGTNVRRLTSGPSEDCPVWSPDGRRIAYEGSQNSTWRIYVVNANGTGIRQITTERWDNRWPQWRPDGSWIAYTGYEHGNGDICMMRPDGTQSIRLTENPAEDKQPSWAGTSLLFHSNRAGRFDIFSVGIASRVEHRLTAETKDTAEVVALMRQMTAVRRGSTRARQGRARRR